MTQCSLVAIRQHSEKLNCIYILGKHLDPQNEMNPLMSHLISIAGIPGDLNSEKKFTQMQIQTAILLTKQQCI